MKKVFLTMIAGVALMAGSAMAQVRVGVGVNFGAPAVHGYVGPSPVVIASRPPIPGPGYVWIDGYRGPRGYVAGYWGRPPVPGAFWVAPRFEGRRFVTGYWGHPRAAYGYRGGFRR